MATSVPAADLERISSECGRASKRVRDLPAVEVACHVIALNPFPAVGHRWVLERLLCRLRWLDAGRFRVSGKGSLSRARQRLREELMKRAFDQLAQPLRRKDRAGCYWREHHLVAFDGRTFALQDTRSNDKESGRTSHQQGPGACPLGAQGAHRKRAGGYGAESHRISLDRCHRRGRTQTPAAVQADGCQAGPVLSFPPLKSVRAFSNRYCGTLAEASLFRAEERPMGEF